MHAKIGRRREHARGAPNRINHIPATDRVNVISDQLQKWMKNFPPILHPNQRSGRPVLGPILCNLPIFLGIALFMLAIDPLWEALCAEALCGQHAGESDAMHGACMQWRGRGRSAAHTPAGKCIAPPFSTLVPKRE